MAFVKLLMTAFTLKKLKNQLEEEKKDAIKIAQDEKPKRKLRHISIDIRLFFKRIWKRIIHCFCLRRFCYKLQHYGSIENYILKSIVGFVGGFILTYTFFLFSVFQLNFKITSATVFCALLGCILTIGLAFSCRVRCIVLLTLPQFFSEKGRQALLAYAFILAISGPAKNTLNNMGILSESLACGQEQLKNAVRQIIDVIKKPFYAIKDAIKKVIKTVKEIIKKIKEILLKIKRIIMAIVRVIKSCFQFLAKVINICNKELGTPFERCTRVFENAILDCNAKLGPLFNWMCSIAYIVQAVCYLVKPFDLVCMIIDFISNSVIGVVIRKVKQFIRHIKTMFYVRIRFSHSFHFETNSSKSIAEISQGIVTEIKSRTQVLQDVFHFLTSAASLFFMFIIFKVVYYRYKFLTSERFDNKYITKDFHDIDLKRAKLEKETVLPLNNREIQVYIQMNSGKLVKTEKKARSKAISTLMTATLKIAIYMASDYSLFWVLNLIKYYGRFQSKVQGPNMPSAFISGKGLLADLLRSIVKAFQPVGIQLEIDTVPCLPTPIPPDLDRYVQIATLLLLCWILTLLEPYGLRFRHKIMSYYHPKRARQRSIWLYNHIMRSRSSFLKFARRQLKRILFGSKGIEKVTCKEYVAANFKLLAVCLDKPQVACLVCGEVFRENDNKKPIKCHTPGCIGVYCKECFKDLQNLCTVCLSPIEYGDLSDIDEEKDSSEEELQKIDKKKEDATKKESKWKCFKKSKESKIIKTPDVIPLKLDYYSSEDEIDKEDLLEVLGKPTVTTQTKPEKTTEPKKRSWFKKCKGKFAKKERDVTISSSDEEYQEKTRLLEEEKVQPSEKEEDKEKPDSDYYSSDVSTDYSYSYQDVKKEEDMEDLQSKIVPFKDVEMQDIPDYASLESFREEPTKNVATGVSDTFIEKPQDDRHVQFTGVPKEEEEMPLIDPDFCFCSDSDVTDIALFVHLPQNESTLITLPRSSNEDIQDPTRKVPPFGPLSILSDVPIPSEICSCSKSSSERFSNVQFEEICESPLSTFSSRNFSSSSYISSSPNSESPTAEIVKHRRIRSERKTIQYCTLAAWPQSSKTNSDTRQRKKVQDYYRAVRDIPMEKIEVIRKGSKIKHFVQKIVSKRKNLGELPLHISEDIELKSYGRPPTKFTPPQCRCVPSTSEEATTRIDSKSERQRGGGRVINHNSYYSLVKEKLAHHKSLGLTVSNLPSSHKDWKEHYLDIDLTPTRDIGFLMIKDDSIELATEATERISKEFQESAFREQTQKLLSPISSGENLIEKKSSSNLSDDFCVSILGKPCTSGRKTSITTSTNLTQPVIKTSHKSQDLVQRSFDKPPEQQNLKTGDVGTNNSKSVAQHLSEQAKVNTNSKHSAKNSIDKGSGTSYKFLEPTLNVQGDPNISTTEYPINSILDKSSIPSYISQDLQDQLALQTGQENLTFVESQNRSQQTSHPSISKKTSPLQKLEDESQQTSRPTISKKTSPLQKVEDESQQTSRPTVFTKSSSKPDTLINSQHRSQQTSHPSISKKLSPLQETFISTDQLVKNDKISTEKIPSSSQEKVLTLENYQQTSQNTSDLLKLPVISPVSLMEKNNQKGYNIPMETRVECRARCARKERPERDIDHYYVPPEPEKLISTSDKILQTSYNDLLQRSPSCRCGMESQQQGDQADAAMNTFKSESVQTQIGTSSDPKHMPTETSSSTPACQYCCKCGHQYWDRNYKKTICRYPSEKSLRSSRHGSPKRRGGKQREKQYSPCEFKRNEGRRKFHMRPCTDVPRQRLQREDVCRCTEDCRCYLPKKTKLYPRPPPLPPPQYKYNPYQFHSSDEDSEPSNVEEEVEEEEEEEYYSDRSTSRYDLPYQNNSDYLDLVQELEETLHNRSRARVKRAMKEFEHKSKYNRPLENPIIKYDETSESEEPLIQKISELTEKKKCCVSGKNCNCVKHSEKRPKSSPRPKSKNRSKSRNRRKPKRHSGKTHWQIDDNSGQWHKVAELYPKHKGMMSRTHSPNEYCPHNCNCCISKNYR